MSDQQAPPPPQRTAAELVLALRVRADCISGQPWEAPATANMMREAADELARLTAAVCEWRVDGDGNYDTNCQNKFIFNDDGPIENGFKFCPYCGGRMSAEPVASSSRMRVSAELATPTTQEERIRDLEAQLRAAQEDVTRLNLSRNIWKSGGEWAEQRIKELEAQLATAQQERDALRRGLIEISTHPHCAYDHPTNLDSSGGNYGIGCADGHRCAPLIMPVDFLPISPPDPPGRRCMGNELPTIRCSVCGTRHGLERACGGTPTYPPPDDYERGFQAGMVHGIESVGGFADQPQWRDIASAPQDGTFLLLWWPHWDKRHPVIGRWFDHDWDSPVRLEGDSTPPTHWLPLPAPPKETT